MNVEQFMQMIENDPALEQRMLNHLRSTGPRRFIGSKTKRGLNAFWNSYKEVAGEKNMYVVVRDDLKPGNTITRHDNGNTLVSIYKNYYIIHMQYSPEIGQVFYIYRIHSITDDKDKIQIDTNYVCSSSDFRPYILRNDPIITKLVVLMLTLVPHLEDKPFKEFDFTNKEKVGVEIRRQEKLEKKRAEERRTVEKLQKQQQLRREEEDRKRKEQHAKEFGNMPFQALAGLKEK